MQIFVKTLTGAKEQAFTPPGPVCAAEMLRFAMLSLVYPLCAVSTWRGLHRQDYYSRGTIATQLHPLPPPRLPRARQEPSLRFGKKYGCGIDVQIHRLRVASRRTHILTATLHPKNAHDGTTAQSGTVSENSLLKFVMR